MQIRARGTHGINLSSLRLSCMTRLQSRCWFPEKQEILFRLDLILDYFFVLFFFHQKYVKIDTSVHTVIFYADIFFFTYCVYNTEKFGTDADKS